MKHKYIFYIIRLWLLISVLPLSPSVSAQSHPHAGSGDYTIVELAVDTLPSLNIARTGHATLCLDGELTVFGGHIDGFVPTATAEYLRDGKWHTIPLTYAHDAGITLELRSGKVFLAGGHKENMGIGQLFSAELYDPATHSTQGFGCMARKRAYGNAAEIADGQVVISGNWYADDAIETFDNVYDHNLTNATELKGVSVPRATPDILRISDDDAIIFGSFDNKANPTDHGLVDRLKGSSYREPFLETWHPIYNYAVHRTSNQFVGDESKGIYEWLLPVENDASGHVAIARVKGPTDSGANATFSLVPTALPLPDSIRGKRIIYGSLVCDRGRGIAYLIGDDEDSRVYVVAVDYGAPAPAPVTVYITDPVGILAHVNTPALTPDGDLVFAGGRNDNNFSPKNSVFRLPLGTGNNDDGTKAIANQTSKGLLNSLIWIVIAVVLAVAIGAIFFVRRRKVASSQSPTVEPDMPEETDDETTVDRNLTKDDCLADLYSRIEGLMENEQLYLNANLKASDVAVRVGSNTTYVSAAINTRRGCSFSQFLTSYRIAYAQNLMRQDPDCKISTISTLSGFSTDSTFFRAFRSITGMSPKEWQSAIRDNN